MPPGTMYEAVVSVTCEKKTIGDNAHMSQDFPFPDLCPKTLSRGFFQPSPFKTMPLVASTTDFT